jgi:hypothetical protein
MKQCPQCNRTYADESITFCLADGALLSAPYDPEATQRIYPPRSTNPPPTEILPAQQSYPIAQKSSPRFIYAIVAMMAVLVIALASMIIVPLISQERKESKNINQTTGTNAKSINETSNIGAQRTVDAETKESPLPTVTPNNPINSTPPSAPTELTGRWLGQWSSPFGTTFSANVYLEAIGTSNGVQGNINWTMKSTPQESKQSKIGLTAVEYIKGSYNPETRLLVMEGYRKDDPNNIITLDKYRLVLAEDSRSLGGATWNHGRWRGRLSLSR